MYKYTNNMMKYGNIDISILGYEWYTVISTVI